MMRLQWWVDMNYFTQYGSVWTAMVVVCKISAYIKIPQIVLWLAPHCININVKEIVGFCIKVIKMRQNSIILQFKNEWNPR